MNTAKINEHGQVSIPVEIRKKLKLKAGDTVGFEQTAQGKVMLEPVVSIAREEAYFYTPLMRKKIRKAEKEFELGKGKAFQSIDEAIAWLKS